MDGPPSLTSIRVWENKQQACKFQAQHSNNLITKDCIPVRNRRANIHLPFDVSKSCSELLDLSLSSKNKGKSKFLLSLWTHELAINKTHHCHNNEQGDSRRRQILKSIFYFIMKNKESKKGTSKGRFIP